MRSPMSLRDRVIRLAHERPELRDRLLPLLKEAGKWQWTDDDRPQMRAEVEDALDLAKGQHYAQAIRMLRDLPFPSYDHHGRDLRDAAINILDDATYEAVSPASAVASVERLLRYMKDPTKRASRVAVDTSVARIRRILNMAVKLVRVPSVKAWLRNDEMGGLERTVRKLLTESEAKAEELGFTEAQVDEETAHYMARLASEAMLQDAMKRQKPGKRRNPPDWDWKTEPFTEPELDSHRSAISDYISTSRESKPR